MKTYVAILRGINVSGKNKIKMNALKSSFSNLGFEKVQTYIQSGNVVFCYREVSSDNLAELINKQILKDYGIDIPVLLLGADQLANIVKSNPFASSQNKETQFLHITFFNENPVNVNSEKVSAKLSVGEEFVISEGVVYLYCPGGYGKTKLNNNFFENQLKVSATTRNWKTTLKLLEMVNETAV